jgi:hypothetical protein
VAYLPVALADQVRGNLGSGCLQGDVAKHAGLPITNNPCPHINAELLLMSRMDTPWEFSSAHWCWLWILMTPSVLKRASSVKSTDETEKCSARPFWALIIMVLV